MFRAVRYPYSVVLNADVMLRGNAVLTSNFIPLILLEGDKRETYERLTVVYSKRALTFGS